MMSCSRIYVDPTEVLMGRARKKRLAHDKNLWTYQLHCAITLREHTPSKTWNDFNRYLNFRNRSHNFLPTRRPCGHFCSKKIQNLVFQVGFSLGWIFKIFLSSFSQGITRSLYCKVEKDSNTLQGIRIYATNIKAILLKFQIS